MLQDIHSPADLRKLTGRQTEALAAEIRGALIDSVVQTGGHLASNLGSVELTLALHRTLNTPRDKIIFDVGHQSYTHKLLTGRQELLATLRQEGGISGFPKRAESEYDAFETGHASTALSSALGMARARDLAGEDYTIATVVGDGALTGGMCYEALNDAGSHPTQLIMVLNDNEMSIAHNVGALSKYLTRLRGSERWVDAKHTVKRGLHRIPLVGPAAASLIERMKRTLRLMLVPGEFFEALGWGYLGPIDGHDIPTLEQALHDARAMQRPMVVHAVTQKGKGHPLAERMPEDYHGVPPFFIDKDNDEKGCACLAGIQAVSASAVVGRTLTRLAADDSRIVAITAAMPQGTGLTEFSERYPNRFFDVGIAEEHAMTMAAGMAAGKLRPVFAVYASFLQRACDQLLHDVCLQRLPVVVLAEHAGFVSGDGATHQGIYDLSMLRAMPGLTIWTPCDERELSAMLSAAFSLDGPCVIRYPKSLPAVLGPEPSIGRWRCVLQGDSVQIISHGHALQTALGTAEALTAQGVSCGVWNASTMHTMDAHAMDSLRQSPLLVVLEEAMTHGGLGSAICEWYAADSAAPRIVLLGVDNRAPGAHSLSGLARECGLDKESVVRKIKEALDG